MSKRYPGGILRKTPQTPTQTSAQGIWDMASVTQAVKENTWPIAGVPDPISKSLRFRSSASAYLNRTPASTGNRQTWTWSGWIKRGSLSSWQIFFGAWDGVGGNDTTRLDLAFEAANTISITGGVTVFRNSTQVFRDPSAWYHIVVVADTTNATAQNRLRIYVNGVEITNWGTNNTVTQNTTLAVNNNASHVIGARGSSPTQYFDGYMTEVYLIDGQVLTPSSFGSTNDQTGVWQPIPYTGTYGTNGFYLPFSNTASTTTLGYDFSGNSNNWTTNNISLTSGSTYDSMVDVPTQWIPYNTAGDTGALWRGNYATLNPLAVDADVTLSNGNLNFSCSSAGLGGTIGTIAVTSGKWYWEVTPTSGTLGFALGIAKLPLSAYDANQTGTYLYLNGGNKRLSPSTDSAYGASWTTNDVIGIALDMDAGTVVFYKNNASQGTAFSSLSGDFTAWVQDGSNGEASVANINFGQRPFSYTPPSGFKTLCTTNLTTPTIGATAATTANKYMDVTTYTGNSTAGRVITMSNMTNVGFAWVKLRSGSDDHRLANTVTGGNRHLKSNATDAESTGTNVIQAFSSNTFTVGSDNSVNVSSSTYVGWVWANDGTSGSTNTAGSITSTVSANTTAGFSVITYTGTGANATVGHGLGVAPSMVIVKQRNGANNWPVWHSGLTGGSGYYVYLDLTNSVGTASSVFNATNPTSSVFSVGTNSLTNGNTNTYVAYCFAPIAGYSAFGSYTGNGSTDGPFVFTGFRPRFVMFKRTDTIANWTIRDTARNPYNSANLGLFPNLSMAEDSTSGRDVDILSNGFKIRGTDSDLNTSSGTYIYACFAEFPFKFSLAR